MTRKQYYVALAVLAVTGLFLDGGWSAVGEQTEIDVASCCLLTEGVSWLPVEWLPEGVQEQVTDQTVTQTINGVRLVGIRQFVETQGGSVGWYSAACHQIGSVAVLLSSSPYAKGVVTVKFKRQTILLKALDSGRFWASPSVKALGGRKTACEGEE